MIAISPLPKSCKEISSNSSSISLIVKIEVLTCVFVLGSNASGNFKRCETAFFTLIAISSVFLMSSPAPIPSITDIRSFEFEPPIIDLSVSFKLFKAVKASFFKSSFDFCLKFWL